MLSSTTPSRQSVGRLRLERLLTIGGLIGVGCAVAVGCFQESGGTSVPTSPTLIAVVPHDFLGEVPCADAPGAMRRYVATLYDVTDTVKGEQPFALPSSPPTDCQQTVAFGHLTLEHWYVARVDGYDRDDVKPLGPGSKVMVDASGAPVVPRWTTLCVGTTEHETDGASDAANDADDASDGLVPSEASDDAPGDGLTEASSLDGAPPTEAEAGGQPAGVCIENDPSTSADRGVIAKQFVTRPASVCSALCENGTTQSTTGLTVELTRALNGLSCGSDPGQVATFSAFREGSTDAPQQAACDAPILFESLLPQRDYTFIVTAFESGKSTPRWGTRCFGVAVRGVVSKTSCDPLSTTGTIGVDVAALAASAGVACTDIQSVTALPGSATDAGGKKSTGCEPIRFDELPYGLYSIDVTLDRGDAGAPVNAICEGLVLPGSVTTASCSLI